MRRLLVLFIVTITLAVFAAGAWANAQPADQASQPIITTPPGNWIGTEIKVSDLEPAPRGIDAAPAADHCVDASPLNLSFANTGDGSGTLTNLYTVESPDPALSCMFDNPTSQRGYRTAWYKLTAGDTSKVTITTEGTEYDTVLGVFAGSCEALELMACSDDFRGFQSSVTFDAVRRQTYYIVVADYHSGVPEAATLQFSAVMRQGGEAWGQRTNLPFGGVSRHAFVSDGAEFYVIGGQTNIRGVPEISNKLLRYNAQLNQWQELADIPGAGLSNTTAVRLGRKIYVPGGFNGDTSDYSNVHLSYDITTDFWEQVAPVPENLLPNGEMFAWSAGAPNPNATSYFLTGGITSYPAFDENAVVIDNAYRFTPSVGQWDALLPLTTPRYAHTAAWISQAGRGLCVVGGLTTGENDEGEPATILLASGECYNPAAGGSWQPTGELNFPRYNAGSAVGPDGRWYIFGGLDADGGVPETEVYHPQTNSWHALSEVFSLGGMPQNPSREWPRGAFWEDTLFVFGGNTPPNEQRVISAVVSMSIGQTIALQAYNLLVPLVAIPRPYNLLELASPLAINVPATGNFVESTQFFNPYYFDWPVFGRASIRLSDIPADTNFNISVYDANKVLRGQGNTSLYGGEKVVDLTLAPGRYYVIVQRIFPKDLPDPADHYRLVVNGG